MLDQDNRHPLTDALIDRGLMDGLTEAVNHVKGFDNDELYRVAWACEDWTAYGTPRQRANATTILLACVYVLKDRLEAH